MALKIDIETAEITEAEPFRLSDVAVKSEEEWWKFSFLKKLDNELFAFDTTGKVLIRYTSQGGWERKGYCLSGQEWTKIECDKLVDMIRYKDAYPSKGTESSGTAGEDIYRQCMLETRE